MANKNYPALISDIETQQLADLAKHIPANGIAVEIGSRLGGSAKIILEHALPSVHLTCFDLEWIDRNTPSAYNSIVEDDAMLQHMTRWNLLQYKTTWEFATQYLAEHTNVTLVPASCPYDITWDTPVDFVFEDSSHNNPQLIDNITFWWERLKPGCIMAGHDYMPAQPQVVIEADKLAKRYNLDLNVTGTLWWVVKPA